MHLLDRAALLARACRFSLEPSRELGRKRIKLGRVDPLGITGLSDISSQILADGIARQAGSARDLADGQLLTQCPAADDT